MNSWCTGFRINFISIGKIRLKIFLHIGFYVALSKESKRLLASESGRDLSLIILCHTWAAGTYEDTIFLDQVILSIPTGQFIPDGYRPDSPNFVTFV